MLKAVLDSDGGNAGVPRKMIQPPVGAEFLNDSVKAARSFLVVLGTLAAGLTVKYLSKIAGILYNHSVETKSRLNFFDVQKAGGG
jgi:hypothetical protein